MKYYSNETKGFYDPSLHGARVLMVVDPSWVAPEQPEEGAEEGELPEPPPMIEVPNPDTLIPEDAVEISDMLHMALLEGQAQGKVITANENGFPFLADPPPPTAEQVAKMYESAVQNKLDEEARNLGYDNISTAVSYAEEPIVPKFQADGQKFRAWRSLCWAYAYDQLALVSSGEREQPTIEEFIAELPALEDI